MATDLADYSAINTNTIDKPSGKAAGNAGFDKTKKPDKRKAIIAAARTLFTTTGYETTTMAEVARTAGVAVGTVYLYFKNKQELLCAVRDNWETEFLEFMNRPEIQAIPHFMRARPLIEACFQICAQNISSVQLMGLSAQMIGEYNGGRQVQKAVEVFFREAVASGTFRAIDVEIAASAAFSMVQGALEQCFDVEGGANQTRYVAMLVDAFEHWLVKPELLSLLPATVVDITAN